MREVLEPLALVSGVRTTAIISLDGVPVATLEGAHLRGNGESVVADLDTDQDLGNIAAQAAAWISEVARAVGQLSWGAPGRMVLRGTQGTLLLQHGPGVVLLVVLEQGVNPEDLRVPMDGAVGRMQRLLRSVGGASPGPLPAPLEPPTNLTRNSEPAGLHPNHSQSNAGPQPGTPGNLSEQAGTN